VSENPVAGPLDPVVTLLGETELFRGLPAEDVRRLATLSRRQRAQPGQVLVESGTPARTCWVVGEGTVEVSGGPSGPATRTRGQVFGEGALASDGLSPITARARDAVELVAIPGADVRRLLLVDSLATRILGLVGSGLPGSDPTDLRPDPPRALEETDGTSRALQRALMPRNAPRVPGYDIAAGTTVEDHGRGNSVWDAIPLPDGREALAVLDVRALGLPAGLLLGMARTALRAAALSGGGVAELLARANAALSGVLGHGGDQFVECALAVPGPDGFEWASAGRMPAGVLGRAGTLDSLTSHGPPLGMMEGFRYGSETVALGMGDALLVLSSGPQGLFRGAADLVAQVQERTAGEVVATVHRGLRKAQGDRAPEVSVLFLRKH
jgi:hypothetical protein